MIAYLPVVAHLYAWHPFEYVLYAAVLLLAEGIHVVKQRILAPRYRVGGHRDVFKLHGGALQACVIPCVTLLNRYAQRLVTEKSKVYQPSAFGCFQLIRAVALGKGVSKERVFAV